jgi:hypothetical protein
MTEAITPHIHDPITTESAIVCRSCGEVLGKRYFFDHEHQQDLYKNIVFSGKPGIPISSRIPKKIKLNYYKEKVYMENHPMRNYFNSLNRILDHFNIKKVKTDIIKEFNRFYDLKKPNNCVPLFSAVIIKVIRDHKLPIKMMQILNYLNEIGHRVNFSVIYNFIKKYQYPLKPYNMVELHEFYKEQLLSDKIIIKKIKKRGYTVQQIRDFLNTPFKISQEVRIKGIKPQTMAIGVLYAKLRRVSNQKTGWILTTKDFAECFEINGFTIRDVFNSYLRHFL